MKVRFWLEDVDGSVFETTEKDVAYHNVVEFARQLRDQTAARGPILLWTDNGPEVIAKGRAQDCGWRSS